MSKWKKYNRLNLHLFDLPDEQDENNHKHHSTDL